MRWDFLAGLRSEHKRIPKWVEDMTYDGMTGRLNAENLSVLTSSRFFFRQEHWQSFSGITDSDRYSLPNRTEWLGVDELL